MAELQYRINELTVQLAEMTAERDVVLAEVQTTAQQVGRTAGRGQGTAHMEAALHTLLACWLLP